MPLLLYPQTTLFDPYVQSVRGETPVDRSIFYLRRPYRMPWTVDESLFILETDDPSSLHTFTLNRTGSVSIVPGEGQITVGLVLQKGANRIEVSTATQTTVITVTATAVDSWMHALGREFYLSAGKRLSDIQNHFLSPWTTRAVSHLIPYSDLFLPLRMPKIHQTRLAIMTSMGGRLGHGDGVSNIAESVTYTTPYMSRNLNVESAMPGLMDDYPWVTTHPTSGEIDGQLLSVWTHNRCFASSQALFKFIMALSGPDVPLPKPLEVVDINDRQMLVRSNGGSIEPIQIDAFAPQCADITQASRCNSDVIAFGEMNSIVDIIMSSPQVSLDAQVENPLNFGFLDSGYWFDGSIVPGFTGIGGSGAFDNVDVDDPFGDGFKGIGLSRRLDGACLDSRIQIGQRLSKFTAPINSSSPPALTPEPPLVEGDLLSIDTATGAPAANIGDTVFWAVSNRPYLYVGDKIRFENPDLETAVVTAWPVLNDVSQIVASDSTVILSVTGGKYVLTGPTKFFTPLHEAYGVELNGTNKYCIVSVNDDGVNSTAVLSGNTANPGAGPHITDVYNPLRDRSDTSEPTLTGSAGNATYEVTISNMLLANLSTGHRFSYRVAPRVSGAITGGSLVSISSDVKPLPSDFLYTTSVTQQQINRAIPNGTFHHTTGFPIYDLEMAGGLSATGALVARTGALTNDGDSFILNDGVNAAITFEFDSNASVVETATLRQVSFTAGDTATQVRDSISLAIANSPTLNVTPTVSGLEIVDMSNDIEGTFGNIAATQTGTSLSSLTGMSGGVDALPALADDQGLFVVRSDSCWTGGAPVTPLMLISLAPAAFIVP